MRSRSRESGRRKGRVENWWRSEVCRWVDVRSGGERSRVGVDGRRQSSPRSAKRMIGGSERVGQGSLGNTENNTLALPQTATIYLGIYSLQLRTLSLYAGPGRLIIIRRKMRLLLQRARPYCIAPFSAWLVSHAGGSRGIARLSGSVVGYAVVSPPQTGNVYTSNSERKR